MGDTGHGEAGDRSHTLGRSARLAHSAPVALRPAIRSLKTNRWWELVMATRLAWRRPPRRSAAALGYVS